MLISVIIPTYNRSNFLKKTIKTLIQQKTDVIYEIIIIDDGSTDDTKSVVSEFKKHNIKYFYQENKERGAARNLGLKKAKGQYINFFDSDDIAYPNHIQTAYEVIINKKLEIFHLGHNIIYENYKKTNNPEGDLTKKLIYGNVMLPISTFIKRSFALEIKFNEDRKLAGTEDYLFWLQVNIKKPVIGFKKVTSALIMHNGRSMNEINPLKTEKRHKLFLSILKKQKIYNKYYHIFKASSFLLVSLDYSLAYERLKSLKFLLISLFICPKFLITKRPYAILFKILKLQN